MVITPQLSVDEQFNQVYIQLSDQSRQELDKMSAQIIEQLKEVLLDKFGTLKLNISRRRLYVMYEDLLNCDAETDHDAPKNVYPIFQQFVEKCERDINLCLFGSLDQIVKHAFSSVLLNELKSLNQNGKIASQRQMQIVNQGALIKALERLLREAHQQIIKLS